MIKLFKFKPVMFLIDRPEYGFGYSITFRGKFHGNYHSFKNAVLRYEATKRNIRLFITSCNPLPVYYMTDETDCDHCRVISSHKACNGNAYIKSIEAMYDWAEGPVSAWRISKKEYLEHETSTRDYILEAFEDGHAHTVYR